MTYRDTFVGRIKKPGFDWTDDSLKLAQADIEFLTPSFLESVSFDSIQTLIRGGTVYYRQLDWGSWAIPATRDEILEYMKRWYMPKPDDEPHSPHEIRADIKSTVEALVPEIEYVLVIEEF